MEFPVATLLGIDYSLALLLIGVVATLATAAAMVAVVYFAWAPYLSAARAEEFGVSRRSEPIEESASD